jgi:hypothetical protein
MTGVVGASSIQIERSSRSKDKDNCMTLLLLVDGLQGYGEGYGLYGS